VDVRQTEVAACVTEGQPLVIEAHDVQNRGVKIVDVDGVFLNVIADVVGLSIHNARPNPTASQQENADG